VQPRIEEEIFSSRSVYGNVRRAQREIPAAAQWGRGTQANRLPTAVIHRLRQQRYAEGERSHARYDSVPCGRRSSGH